jgi:AcrR family transcriptional regulator
MGIRERKDREKDLRRQQIREAAKELFLLKGFSSTTMEDIAKKAELSPATIYLYFKNKDELYVSLNVSSIQYFTNNIKRIHDDSSLSVEEKILKIKDAMYNMYKYDPLMLRNIMHIQMEDTLLNISRDLVGKINNLATEVMEMIAHIYEEGVRQGKFKSGRSIALADIMWGIFAGLVMWEESKRRLNPRKDFLKSTLDKAFDIFLKGIRKGR